MRRVVLLAVNPLDHAAAADLTRVPHADALHDGARTLVVPDRAGHHGLHSERIERERQPGPPDLRRVAATPELPPQRPSDLEPVRVRDEWAADLVRGAHPRLRREEAVDLAPVVVERRAGQAAAPDDLAARAVVGDPLVDAVQALGETARRQAELRRLSRAGVPRRRARS